MGEPTTERLDPDSDLYIRNALSHIRAACSELTAAIEVQEDEELINAMESANLAASSVEGGLSGILEMMRRRKTEPTPLQPPAPDTPSIPADYADSAE